MLKISAFSQLSHVSVKTLRYYDELGLLKPAVVDDSNGYRYYSEDQLLTVKRIAAYKEQGFTLEQMMPFLKENISADVVENKLADKRSELERAIREAQQQLDAIDGRLSRVKEAVPQQKAVFSVTVRSVAPELAASIRDTVPRHTLCVLLHEVTQYVRAHGESEDRPLTVLWHDGEQPSGLVDVEVAIPVTNPIPGKGSVKVGLLPEVNMAASVVHYCDPYSDCCMAEGELRSWIAANGFVTANAPVRETYLTSDKDIYGTLRLSELLIPIERA
ncbi:MerR family transcriptional regulator [Paenibacillus allorhizosphaerae]|uniref:HTH merR-type domain-containing protein n=1 Tax=Paenibacillus allorhizosphaerae TaxID=2849866 RepID=A0ABM8VME7_9BACL|nr:MerR family transcriptional regulator [Paenibacillus allorhizosphaerae]CAG7649897.1 hypothetical protein PAECIP111802_04586 [Paenibacillus allorhizosphaerae]